MIGRLTGHLAVSAGAGAGKTRALVELALGLLAGEATGEPCEPGSLVAITFTERAAAELEERLRAAVAGRARAAGEEAAPWRRRLHDLERMTVGTIHAFAAALLREHPVEAGLDPEFQVLDEESADGLRREAAREAALAAAAGEEAARALLAGHGAGGRHGGLAGLLTDLVRQRASLGLGVAPEPAPVDPSAAGRAREALLGAAETLLARRGEARTASGQRAVEALQAALGGLAPGDRTEPLDLPAARRLQGVAGAVSGWRAGKGEARELAAARAALSEAGEAVVAAAAGALAVPQAGALCRLVARAEAGYARRKVERGALDFDDLLFRARDLLHGDGGVRAEVRARTRALLVDEYQDVNRVQQEIFDLLAGGEPPGPLLVAVGDLKQSIYRFRGADVTVFAGLLGRLGRERAGRVIHLARNHRSTPAVLDLVNAVFERAAPARGDHPYQVGFGEEDRLVAARLGRPGPACEILALGGGSAAERRGREARALAERIRALVSGEAGATVPDRQSGEPRPPRHGEVAVLFRRLTQVGEYERALRATGIPYRMARGGGFYQAPEVRDLGELLRSLAEPEDGVAWAALLRSPACGVSDGTLLLLARLGLATLARRDPGEVVDAVRAGWGAAAPGDLDAEVDRLRRFLAEWHALRPLRDRLPLADLLDRAVERLDLEPAHLASPDGERRLGNIRKALGLARRFAATGGTAGAFAARLRELALRPPREPEAELEAGDAVALLSVHQAKGLEWPVVVVPDLSARPRGDARRAAWDGEGRLAAAFFDLAGEEFVPGEALRLQRGEERRAAAAESLRLLYVALTRARDYLVLSGESGGEGTWASWVGAAVAARPDLAARVPAAEAATFAVGPPAAARPIAAPAPAEPCGPPPLARPAPLAAVRLAVTDLAEYARCPRRHAFAFRLGLPERPLAEDGAPVRDDPARATARGTLAHAMLAESDLGAPPLERRAQLAMAAARRGYDPGSPAVRRILADVSGFLEGSLGRRLAALARGGTLRRELPFLLRLGGAEGLPACYLSGAIDALWEERGVVALVDFKYAVGRPEERERYRLQLTAYALAASRAFPGRRVRAALQFLRGGLAEADVTPSPDELVRFAAEAPRLALGAFRGDGEWLAPADLGRSEARCRAEGCGYRGRCFPSRPTAPARAPAATASAAAQMAPAHRGGEVL